MSADEPTAAQPGRRRSLGRRLFDHLEEIVSGTALVIVVLSASWGVFTRYLTKTPATWAGELATLAAALILAGLIAILLKRGESIPKPDWPPSPTWTSTRDLALAGATGLLFIAGLVIGVLAVASIVLTVLNGDA